MNSFFYFIPEAWDPLLWLVLFDQNEHLNLKYYCYFYHNLPHCQYLAWVCRSFIQACMQFKTKAVFSLVPPEIFYRRKYNLSQDFI